MLSKLKSYELWVIFGLGREGLSTYHYLRQQDAKKSVILVDVKNEAELGTEWAEILKNDAPTSFHSVKELELDAQQALVFRSAGIPRSRVEKLFLQAEISSNTQLFLEVIKEKQAAGENFEVVGVTGTKGKSTTTAAIYHVLQANGLSTILGGNIGKPPLDLVTELENGRIGKLDNWKTGERVNGMAVVLEMSSHQLSDLTVSPDVAVVQNVLPEHLDYYGDFEEYWTAKSQIARFQDEDDVMIFNADSVTATRIAQLSPGKKYGFRTSLGLSYHDPDEQDLGVSWSPAAEDVVAYEQDRKLWYAGQEVMPVAALPLLGSHNWYNVLPAVIVGRLFGLANAEIAQALTSFAPLPHRLEKVAEHDGVLYINDSLATNPPATMAALEAVAAEEDIEKIVLIAGGYDRGLDYTELGEKIMELPVAALVLFEPTGQQIAQAIADAAQATNTVAPEVRFVETMSEAVTTAREFATPGTAILMSPASASFGRFKDYADRGEQFRKEANAYGSD